MRSVDAVTPYVDEIASQFQFERKVKLVVDAGNGTAGPTVHRLFEKLDMSKQRRCSLKWTAISRTIIQIRPFPQISTT